MDQFFRSNPGFRSRVAHHIDFPDYTDADLIEIGERMLAGLNDRLSEGARAALTESSPAQRAQPLFANARSIRTRSTGRGSGRRTACSPRPLRR